MSIRVTIDGREVELGPRGKRLLGYGPTQEDRERFRRETLWEKYNLLDWDAEQQPEDVLKEDMLNYYYQQILNGDVCVYCHSTRRMTRDHIKPKSEGYTLEWQNKAPACERCNHKKGALSVLDFLLSGRIGDE
jgi:5-methylcytosine-specific restriction endonuclease McrA